jgi:hypothetical protein
MSVRRLQTTTEVEEESYDVFAETLKKIMETSPENRGPAAKAIMAGFQVYFGLIGGAASRTEKKTR